MNEFDCISVTLYAHNLNDPSRSFSNKHHISDFKKGLYWTIKKAKKVTYVNPKGEELVLKQKK